MRILLVNPPVKNAVRSEVPSAVAAHVGVFPPLGLLYVASFCNARTPYRSAVLDAVAEGLSGDRLEERIDAAAPDIVGITAHTHNLVDVVLTAAMVKRRRPRAHVCLGGVHATHFPREAAALPGVDSVIPGEGEAPFSELALRLGRGGSLREVKGLLFRSERGIVDTGRREPPAELDGLPWPDRSLLDPGRYRYILSRHPVFTTMSSSRGCPYACTFCSTVRGACRLRSAESVVAEMGRCAREGARDIHFIDDIFNIDPDRVARICSLLRREPRRPSWSFRGRVDRVSPGLLRDLRRAGCYSIHFGVECSSDEGLSALRKGVTLEQARRAFALARAAGIRTVAYFLVGCPHERSRTDVLRTAAFARELRADYALFNILTPYPATPLYEAGLRAGIIPRDVWGDFIKAPRRDFRYPFWNEHFTNEELASLLGLAYRRFYLRPGFLWGALRDRWTWKVLARRVGSAPALLRRCLGGGEA